MFALCKAKAEVAEQQGIRSLKAVEGFELTQAAVFAATVSHAANATGRQSPALHHRSWLRHFFTIPSTSRSVGPVFHML